MNDLSNMTALIAGGTSGIGRAVALALSNQGADVIIIGRNQAKGEAVVKAAQKRGTQRAEFIQADLSEMEQVRQVAQRFLTSHKQLNILVHSVGVHHFQRTLTSDGIEYNFAANYLNKFLLTNLLLEPLRASSPARLIVIGSPYVFDPKRFLTFHGLQGKNLLLPLWALLKAGMATSVWTVALSRQLQGTGVTVNNVVPGIVRTDILRNDPAIVRAIDWMLQPLVGMTPEQAARTPLYLATSDAVAEVTGQFFKATRRGLKRTKVPTGTFDPEVAQRLWTFSDRLAEASSPSPH